MISNKKHGQCGIIPRPQGCVTFVGSIEGVIEDEYFELAVGSMKGLLSAKANELTGFKVITRADVKKASLEATTLISLSAAA